MLQEIDLRVAGQGYGNKFELHQIRRQLTATFEKTEATFNERVDVLAAADIALSTRTATLEATASNLQGNVNTLVADVTSMQATITTQGNTITGQSSAINALTAEVTSLEDQVTANAASIQSLTAEVSGISSSVSIRATAGASPGGGWASYGVLVKTGSGDTWSTAAYYVETNGSLSRIVFAADQTIFRSGSGQTAQIVLFDAQGAYFANARIGNLRFDQLSSANDKIVLKGSGNNASLEVFT